MCYMVVVGIPEEAERKWLPRLPEGLNSWMASYPGLSAHMDGFTPHIIGTSMCSCDLFHPEADPPYQLRKRYRRKGWSESKIDRAMENRRSTEKQNGLREDVRHWLAETVEEGGAAYLWVHWDSEERGIEQTVGISSIELRENTFPIEEEMLYYLFPSF